MLHAFSRKDGIQYEPAKPKRYTVQIAFFAKNFTKERLSIETQNRTQGEGFCGCFELISNFKKALRFVKKSNLLIKFTDTAESHDT